MDGIIQKATELGVHRVVPLVSERVVSQVNEARAEHKLEHWRTVAIEACKQCGSAWLPTIEPPITPAEYIARGEQFDLAFIASLQVDARHPGEWFRTFALEQVARRGHCACGSGPKATSLRRNLPRPKPPAPGRSPWDISCCAARPPQSTAFQS